MSSCGVSQRVELLGKTFSVETEIDGSRLRAEIFLGGKLMAIREALLENAESLEPVARRAELLQYHQEVIASITDRAEKRVMQKMSNPAEGGGSVLQFPGPSGAKSKPAGIASLTAEALDSAALSLAILGSIDGFLGACLVDESRGIALSQQSGGTLLDLETAAVGIAEMVQEERTLMSALGLTDPLEDILISLGRQYHLIRPLGAADGTFLYLILDRSESNLARARRELESLETVMSDALRDMSEKKPSEVSIQQFRRESRRIESLDEELFGEACG